MRRHCGTAIGAILLSLVSRTLPAAQGAGGVQQLIDNERVTVLDMKLDPGIARERLGRADCDVVVVGLGRGVSVAFEPKGASKNGTPLPPDSSRAIVIELKDRKVPPLPNTSGYPNAFPRPGVKKVLENVRVTAWDYTWAPGVPTPMHFHDKDVVVVYLEDGALKSTTPDGQSVVNEHFFGFTKFNSRDRAHTEQLVKGKARAIIVELK
jgi:hypothetical protein